MPNVHDHRYFAWSTDALLSVGTFLLKRVDLSLDASDTGHGIPDDESVDSALSKHSTTPAVKQVCHRLQLACSRPSSPCRVICQAVVSFMASTHQQLYDATEQPVAPQGVFDDASAGISMRRSIGSSLHTHVTPRRYVVCTTCAATHAL